MYTNGTWNGERPSRWKDDPRVGAMEVSLAWVDVHIRPATLPVREAVEPLGEYDRTNDDNYDLLNDDRMERAYRRSWQ